jgi:predicted  nucleic acid-binding Zn-ribbon protein
MKNLRILIIVIFLVLSSLIWLNTFSLLQSLSKNQRNINENFNQILSSLSSFNKKLIPLLKGREQIKKTNLLLKKIIPSAQDANKILEEVIKVEKTTYLKLVNLDREIEKLNKNLKEGSKNLKEGKESFKKNFEKIKNINSYLTSMENSLKIANINLKEITKKVPERE